MASSMHKSQFQVLLRMLHEKHEEELASQRLELEHEFKAQHTEMLDMGRRLKRMQPDTSVEQEGHDGIRAHEPVLEKVESSSIQAGDGEQCPVDSPNLCIQSPDCAQGPSGQHVQFSAEHDASEPTEETVYSEEASIKSIEQKRQSEDLSKMKLWSIQRKRHTRLSSKIVFLWRKKLFVLLSHPYFEIACAVAILSNALVMGVQIDYSARNESDPYNPPILFRVLDYVYCFWFISELLLKLIAFGCSFFYGEDCSWNLFDFIVVSIDAFQTVLDLVSLDSSQLGNLTFLRILRVLRVTRAIKVVRVVRFFREFRIMVGSVIKCGASLMWSILMFVAIIYTFGVLLLNSVSFFVYEHKSDEYYGHYKKYWSSLPAAMWTLFSCMTGGVSWMEVGDPLIHIGWVYGAILGFFMFFTIFVVTNIITGIFVDSAIQKAENDRDEMVQKDLSNREESMLSLKMVFEDLDADRSGTLTLKEFESHLEDERVQALFESVTIQVQEARELFDLLDVRESHQLRIEEFLYGCMRLKGPASSIDLATLKLEVKHNAQALADIMSLLKTMRGQLEHVETLGGPPSHASHEVVAQHPGGAGVKSI